MTAEQGSARRLDDAELDRLLAVAPQASPPRVAPGLSDRIASAASRTTQAPASVRRASPRPPRSGSARLRRRVWAGVVAANLLVGAAAAAVLSGKVDVRRLAALPVQLFEAAARPHPHHPAPQRAPILHAHVAHPKITLSPAAASPPLAGAGLARREALPPVVSAAAPPPSVPHPPQTPRVPRFAERTVVAQAPRPHWIERERLHQRRGPLPAEASRLTESPRGERPFSGVDRGRLESREARLPTPERAPFLPPAREPPDGIGRLTGESSGRAAEGPQAQAPAGGERARGGALEHPGQGGPAQTGRPGAGPWSGPGLGWRRRAATWRAARDGSGQGLAASPVVASPLPQAEPRAGDSAAAPARFAEAKPGEPPAKRPGGRRRWFGRGLRPR